MSVLTDAIEAVADRDRQYGDARSNAEMWAKIVSAATGLNVQSHHYPVMMIAAKLARLTDGYHHDSWVDVAGYARVAELIERSSDG